MHFRHFRERAPAPGGGESDESAGAQLDGLENIDITISWKKIAMAMLEGKLEEAGVRDRTELRTVLPRDIVRIGKSFVVEYMRNTHSMADSFSVAIFTPLGVVIHTGDFKFDHTPVDGEHFDLQRLVRVF